MFTGYSEYYDKNMTNYDTMTYVLLTAIITRYHAYKQYEM